eukprot:g80442.t1
MVFATACFGMAFRGDGKQTASDNLNTSWELGEGRRGHYVFFKKNATVDLSSRRDLFSRAFFEGEVVLGTPFWCREFSMKQSENSEVRVELTLKLGAQRAAFLMSSQMQVSSLKQCPTLNHDASTCFQTGAHVTIPSKTRMLPGHVRARRAPVYVGLLAGAKSRPPTCGEMRSGSVPIGPATNDAFSQHFTMRLDRGLSIGMQPITLLGPDSRNPMHLINSSSAGFNDGSTSRAHNAKISKKQLVVTLTSDVRRDHEILLSYSQNDALVVTTSPSDAHPDWLKEALSNRERIPVWTFDLADGIHLYFIVPPAQQPLLEQSRSLSLPKKQVLIRSLSDMPPPRSKTLCITTEKKQQLLDSTVNELFRSSSGASLKREASRITVLDGEKHLTQQPPIRVLKREASDATVVLARASSSSLMSRIDPFALLEGLVSDAEAETECDENEALVVQTAPPTEVETACDEDETLVSQTAPPTEVDTECIEDEESVTAPPATSEHMKKLAALVASDEFLLNIDKEEEIEYDFACPVRRLQPARRSYVIEDVMSSSQPLYVSMGLGEWHGVNDDPNGEPIKIFLKRPEGDLPPKLPVGAFVTPRLKKDIRALARKYCWPEERAWIEEMLEARNLTQLHFDGAYGEGDLPGRPAHMECVDASGKIWRIDLRVLGELPTNRLELPPQRKEKIQALHSLTKEELKNLPRTYFVNDGNPPAHPPWRGAQELTPEEKQAQDIAFASASAPWRKVTHLLRISQNKETFAASHMVMKELKLWLREHGVATQDKDRKQFVKKKLIDLVWEHSQICSCGLEEDDNKEMKDEVDAPSADEPEPESEQEPESAAAPARGRGGRRGRQAAAAPARGRGRRGGRRRGRRVAGSARGGGGARKRARSEEDGKSLPPRRRHQLVIEELPGALSEGEWECPRPTCRFINKTGGGVCEMCECPPVSDSDASSEENENM